MLLLLLLLSSYLLLSLLLLPCVVTPDPTQPLLELSLREWGVGKGHNLKKDN